jgi:hypothetical protein
VIRFRLSLVSLLACALVVLTSCGLDTFIYFYPVSQYLNWPSEDSAYNYFSFRTSDEKNGDNVYFKGYEIYYRIYNNSSTRSSDVSSIATYNTNNPTTAYTYLIDTKKYVRMNAQTRLSNYPLFSASTTNQTVVIRFLDYGIYSAGVTVDGANYGLALRTIDNLSKDQTAYTFTYDEIQSSDSDVSYSTWDDATQKKWYVQAFVMAYGYDESYKVIYSSVFNIGYITIRAT